MVALQATPPRPRVLYLLPRFPTVTETFLLDEIAALDAAGVELYVLALTRRRVAVLQPRARELAARVRFVSPTSACAAFGAALFRHPTRLIAMARHCWEDRPRRSWRARYKHWAAFLLAPAVARVARRHAVEHLHAAYLGHPATVVLLAAELTALPFSAAAHAHDIFKESAGLARKLRRAAFVRVISRYNQRYLQRLAPELDRSRLPLIPCGVEQSWFMPPPRFPRAPGAGPGQTSGARLLAVAQLEPYKAIDQLLEALAILIYRGFTPRLTIIGSGSAEADLRCRAESLELHPPRIEWRGARSTTEVRAALDEATLLVVPARRERSGKQDGVPLVIAEAMARGVAVVATRISGVPELVQHRRNGYLVPPEDPGALAHAIATLLDAPLLRRRLAKAGRATAVRSRRLDDGAACLATLFRAVQRGALPEIPPPPCAASWPPLPHLVPATAARPSGLSRRHRASLRARESRAEDLPRILELFALAFGPREAARRRQRWHWFSSFGSPATVIEEQGRILGCLMTVSVPLWVGDREVSCRWIGATAVHPEHRGVAGALAGIVRREQWLASGFPLPRMEQLWRRVDRHGDLMRSRLLRLWVRPLWGGRRRRELDTSLCPWEQQGWPAPREFRYGGSQWQVVVRPRLGAEWESWLTRAVRSWPVTLARSVALCNQLLGADPVGPHAFVLVYRQGAPVAYAAVDFYTDYRGQMQAGLGDCLTVRGDARALTAVVRAATRYARLCGAQNLKMLEPGSRELRRAFRRLGFWPGRSPGHALLLAHTPPHVAPAWYGDLENWHLPRIWADPRRF